MRVRISAILTLILGLCTAGVCLGTVALVFNTLDNAAHAALSEPADPVVEQAGVIFRDPQGGYTYSQPQKSRRTDKFELRVDIPRGYKIVGVYHTHPDTGSHDIHADFFTPADVELADRLGVPSYILTLRSGEIRKYVPGSSRIIRDRTLSAGKISRGELL
jgi:proteasome lid subunit RPN8/RPN11